MSTDIFSTCNYGLIASNLFLIRTRPKFTSVHNSKTSNNFLNRISDKTNKIVRRGWIIRPHKWPVSVFERTISFTIIVDAWKSACLDFVWLMKGCIIDAMSKRALWITIVIQHMSEFHSIIEFRLYNSAHDYICCGKAYFIKFFAFMI